MTNQPTANPSGDAGFSPIVAVLAVLIIAGVGLGGWYVMNKQDSDGKKQAAHTSQNKSDDKEQEKQATPSDPSEGGRYLVITEWGVRFPVPDQLKGKLVYFPNDQPDTMAIDSNEFPEGSECSSFDLVRTTERVSNSVDPQGFDSSSVAHFGKYYFSRGSGFIACSGSDTVQNRAAEVQKLLYEATADLESL